MKIIMASQTMYPGGILVCIVIAVVYSNTLPTGDKYTYDFNVSPTTECPKNESAFLEGSTKMNCSKGLRYLCAPDRYLASLIEFCTDRKRSPFAKGNCVRLEGRGDLNHVNCENIFTFGCPDRLYFDDQIYLFPSCLEINTQKKCFIAERNCSTERFQDVDITTSPTENTSSTGNMTFITSEESIVTTNLLQYVFFILLFIPSSICICAVGYHKKKVFGKSKEAQPFIPQSEKTGRSEEAQPFIPQSEMTGRSEEAQPFIPQSEKTETHAFSSVIKTEWTSKFARLSADDRIVIYCFLFLKSEEIDINSEGFLNTVNLLRKFFEMREVKQEKCFDREKLVDFFEETAPGFFKILDGVLDESFNDIVTKKYKSHKEGEFCNFFLQNAPFSTISKYFVTSGYPRHENHNIICLPQKYDKLFMEKIGESILYHKSLQDLRLHEYISKKYEIPREVLESLDSENIKEYRSKNEGKESQDWHTHRRGEILSLHPDERSFLYLFMFTEDNIVDTNNEEWSHLFEKIRLKLKLHHVSKEDLEKIMQNKTISDLITDEQKKYKLVSSDVLSELCWTFHCIAFQDINEAYNFFLENANKKLISLFYRTTEYVKCPGEKCFCLPVDYNDKFLDILEESVLEHITIEDTSVHKKIAEKYNLPIEVLEWGKDGIKRFTAYLKEGKEPVYHTRGMIIGCAGAGKTTLLGRLKNQTMREIQRILPTKGLDVHQDVFKIEKNQLQYNKEKNLSSFNIPSGKIQSKPIDLATSTTGKPTFRFESPETEDTDKENRFQMVHSVSSFKEDSDVFECKDGNDTQQRKVSFDSDYIEDQQKETPVETITEDQFKQEESRDKGISKKNKSSTIKTLFPSISSVSFHGEPTLNLITLLDFAGQCAYYASHQIYLSPMAFYILVVDMSKNIDETADEETCDQNDTIFEEWKYRDYYSFWMKSIHLYSGARAPVILVATHKDKLPEEKIQGILGDLKKLFLKELKQGSHVREDRIFCTGFPKENVSLESVEEIQKAIIDLVSSEKFVLHWGVELPSSWVIFEKEIQKQKTKAKMISILELCRFNEQIHEMLQFDQTQIKDMLRYFHEIGSILYFDSDGLRDTVILDIQWFVDAFKHVITERTIKRCAEKLDDLHETGELDDDLLEEIWRRDQTFLEHKDGLLNYMQHLGMIVKANAKNNNVCHIVPCMSRRKPEREIFESYRKSPILCVKLDFLPHFVFLKLVVACMCSPGWGVRHDKDNRKCIYRTCCLLAYDKTVLALYTTEDNCIEVQILEKKVDQTSIQSKIQIKRKILDVLRAIAKTFHTPLQLSIGYRCKRTNFLKSSNESSFFKEDELKKLIEDSNPVCHNCPITKEHNIDVKDIYFYWNREKVSSSSIAGSFSKPFPKRRTPYTEEKTREFGIEGVKGFDSMRSACTHGNVKQFEYELGNFLNNYKEKHLMRKDRDGCNLMHFACEGGNIDILKKLLKKGFKLDTTTYSGRTSLHIAALEKHLQMCEFIVTSQPSILHVEDKRGGNVAHFAAEGGDVEILRYLIAKDVNAKKTTKSERNILHIAVSNNREEMCEFISEEFPEILLSKDEEEWNPLHFAAATGAISIFELLSKQNLNVFDTTIMNDSVLHIACQNKELQMCKYLVSTYPSLVEYKNNQDWIPSFSAAAAGDVEILELLKANGSNEERLAKGGHTILHIASKYSNFDACSRLVSHYPYMVHGLTDRGWSALHMLAAGPPKPEKSEEEEINVFELLMSHQADVMKKTKNGSSVLQLACKNKKIDLCEHMLKNYKSLINIPGIDLIEIARDTKDEQMVELFESHCKEMT